MNLQAMIVLALKISIVLTVFAVGLNATFSDATFLFRRPGKLIRAFLSMNVVMPFLALVLVLSFNLHPAVKIALAALSVSPVPPFFPNNVLQAGGRENYTVGLLVATAVLSIAVIPITMEIFEQVVHTRFAMPAGSIAKVVFVTVLAPLMGAIALRAVAPVFAQKAAKPLGMFATILLTLSCLPVLFGSLRRSLSLIGDGTLLSFAVFALVGYAIGHWLGGPPPGRPKGTGSGHRVSPPCHCHNDCSRQFSRSANGRSSHPSLPYCQCDHNHAGFEAKNRKHASRDRKINGSLITK